MRILLLSAYDAASHRSWCDGLRQCFNEYQFTTITMPARHFAWRIRGNPLFFAEQIKQYCTQGLDWDLLLVTSMVDVATLKGLLPAIASLPTVVYFHENQFAYPASRDAHQSIEPQMVNLYSALAADMCVFNSEYNLKSFLDGAKSLLHKLPDCVPYGLVDTIVKRAEVVPVGLADDVFKVAVSAKSTASERTLEVVWNHRWEYDKGPERLLAFVKALPEGLALRFHIVGQRFRNDPECFIELAELLKRRQWLGQWGPVSAREEYLALLAQSDYVLSTAIHDFQGLAVLEAMALGCLPLVPDRLAYSQFVAGAYRYQSSDTIVEEADSAAQLFMHLLASRQTNASPALMDLTWSHLKPRYQAVFDSCVDVQARG